MPSGRISKHGDAMLRSLLYEATHSLLTVVRRAHPLKNWARRIKKRTGHKKVCVTLARKLATILHRMLITGEPFRWPAKQAATTAQITTRSSYFAAWRDGGLWARINHHPAYP